ncbi:glycosyltransferase family 2 protein [Leptospira limi]|uniref:Glycosyltransferase n=1 Tax=Leptospira limi TaxID=2950023 RepID=A0ABT3LZ15_9LEPT|nr:glycosyltransferase [Leptospira limi]MCW7462953.1 glycosyltransferase [Leptospira limi]
MNPFISIVIPTYNHSHFLKKSLGSVVTQSYINWEAIVIDNHSSDTTDEVVNSFSDSRIRLKKIHNHGIIASSRNLGILESKGEWISFLDSDDFWYSDKLEKTVSEIIKLKNEVEVICHNEFMVYLDSDGKSILKYGPYEMDFYRKMLFYGNRLSTSATTVNRKFLFEKKLLFSEEKEFVTVEDYDLWLRLANENARFCFIQETLGEYTIHGSNQSGSLDRHMNHLENLIKHHVFQIQSFELDKNKLWRKFRSRLKFDKAIVYLREKRLSQAVILLIRSFFNSPSVFVTLLTAKISKWI